MNQFFLWIYSWCKKPKKIETEVETKTENQVETKTETKTENQVETKTENQIETKTETKTENQVETKDSYTLFIEAVEKGDTENVKKFLQTEKNLNEALKIACIKNFYGITEMLLEKGALPLEGLRVSKSPNITRLLYKYENSK